MKRSRESWEVRFFCRSAKGRHVRNKSALLHLVDRAERGVLLAGEAAILRDAIELLGDMVTTLDALGRINAEIGCLETVHRAYQPSGTQAFKTLVLGDDDAPGRP